MPLRDGTGPAGQGPLTGRGLGPCGTSRTRRVPKGYWMTAIAPTVKKGALTAYAKKHKGMTKRGTISIAWLHRMAKKGGKLGLRARLALRYHEAHS